MFPEPSICASDVRIEESVDYSQISSAMPTSNYRQLPELLETLFLVNPTSILDVGTGLGKLGVLGREYLEGHSDKSNWRRRIDGIEGFAPYISPIHSFVYDQIFMGEAQTIVPALNTHYDLVLLIDVIEHFEHQSGQAFLSELCRHTDNILLSTPKQFFKQDAVFGNALEEHKSYWVVQNFLSLGPVCVIPSETSLICLIGKASNKAHREYYSFRQVLKREFPFLARLYRLLKKVVVGK